MRGNAEGERRFTRGRAAGNDHEVAALKAGGQLVEVHKPGRDTGALALELQELADLAIDARIDRPDALHRIARFAHRNIVDLPLRVVEDDLGLLRALGSVLRDPGADVDEPPAHRVGFDDLDIVLESRSRR